MKLILWRFTLEDRIVDLYSDSSILMWSCIWKFDGRSKVCEDWKIDRITTPTERQPPRIELETCAEKRHIFQGSFPIPPAVIWIYFLRVHAKFFASHESCRASSARVSHKNFNATKRPTFLPSLEIVGNNYASSAYIIYTFYIWRNLVQVCILEWKK